MLLRFEGNQVSVSDKVSHCQSHGNGTLTCYGEDGVTVSWTYKGAFVNGRMTGQGTTTWKGTGTPDDPGYIYDGAHVDGSAEGSGIWHRLDGTMMYKGNSKAEEYDGQGTSYRPDGTKEYEGEWEASYWHGQGTLFCPDGITPVHDGVRCWKNGSSFSYEDGSRYEGEWHDDDEQKHGWGIKYRPDGTIEHSGWWENDQPRDEPPPNDPDAL